MRILVRHRDRLLKFVVVESSDRDGSLSVVLRREGNTGERQRWTTRPGDEQPQTIVFPAQRTKNKRITIHASGRVNYHDDGGHIFIDPLTRTTRPTAIYGYRVPAMRRLDEHQGGAGDEDAVLDLSNRDDGAVSFSFLIAPADFMPPGQGIRLAYQREGYSFAIYADEHPFVPPQGMENHFITYKANEGPFTEQQMSEEEALIRFHQALAGTEGDVMYAPNGEGYVRLIFAVPMRIAPRFAIELDDPALHVTDQDIVREQRSERVMIKFRVRNRTTGEIVRRPIAFRSIELNAEL